MTRVTFNDNWWTQPKVSVFSAGADRGERTPVTLPHDAMIRLPRSAHADGGAATGYFPSGAVEYTKEFDVPDSWAGQRVTLELQAVYRDAVLFVNGVPAGRRPFGYSLFRVPLDPFLVYGSRNTIRIEARAHQDSRWYSGLGIIRDTALIVDDLVHVGLDSPTITTPDVDDERAVVVVTTRVVNDDLHTHELALETHVLDPDGRSAAADTAPVTVTAGSTAVVRQRLYLQHPQRWGLDTPNLYTASVRLTGDERTATTTSVPFGVRTVQVDPVHGLRLNGTSIKLRGTCIHHDNGVLGAATIARADERRIELLKAAGFNAVRSAHNPMSIAMLDACDRLGVLVMDEAFDMWAESKSNFDYSLAFPDWWERDLESMVAKDRNHPSVIIYSIGNEILEAGRPLGAATGRKLAEKVRSLDPTRFITNGVSGFVAGIGQLEEVFAPAVEQLQSDGNINDLMSAMTDLYAELGRSPVIADITAESHSVVDIVGHNYAVSRYVPDVERFPNRVVIGTETVASEIDRIWSLVEANAYVIGDFTWTGWDYLGEVGLGRTSPAPDGDLRTLDPPRPGFPWLLARCGDIDITGFRRPASYYREIVYGLRDEPYIAVVSPSRYGKRLLRTTWSWTDTTASWTWDLDPGDRVEVEVYSSAETVELLLEGRSLGTRLAGTGHRFRAVFDVPYEPGELVAVARTGGVEVGRHGIRSATGPVRISARADRDTLRADDTDLAFVPIEFVDASGTLVTNRDREVRVTVSGPGVLQGFGSAAPVTDERFDSDAHRTFEGRALAVVRPTGAGRILVSIESKGQAPTTLALTAEAS